MAQPLDDAAAMPAPATASQAAEDPASAHGFNYGRLELAIGQGIAGAILGAEYCIHVGCGGRNDYDGSNNTGFVAWGLGATGALAGVFLGGDITDGQAMLVNTSSILGGLHGWMISDRTSYSNVQGAMVGQVVGTATGVGLAMVLRPENDRMALANSAALWTGVLVALARDARDHAAVLPTATIAADIGFAIGYAAWPAWPVTRGQAAAIDLGGAIGLTAGVFLGAVIPDRQAAGEHTLAAVTAICGGVGVGTALLVLRNKPFPKLPVHVVPRADGVALAGVW